MEFLYKCYRLDRTSETAKIWTVDGSAYRDNINMPHNKIHIAVLDVLLSIYNIRVSTSFLH